MKIKRNMIVFLLAAFSVCLCGCGEKLSGSGSSVTDQTGSISDEGEGSPSDDEDMSIEGLFVATENGSMFLDESGGPVQILNEDEFSDVISKLETGDVVMIRCDRIMESYPAKTQISSIELVREGDFSDVSEDTVKNLDGLGWKVIGG